MPTTSVAASAVSPAGAPAPRNGPGPPEAERLLAELSELRAEVLAVVGRVQRSLERVAPQNRESALNLLCYLALRRHDLRPLQGRLSALGLSSLGRAESEVLATLDAVLDVLRVLAGAPRAGAADGAVAVAGRGQTLLAQHADALLGPVSRGRDTRIMVTMPSEAADDPALIHELLKRGMDCMRINCAHDDAAAWLRMIGHLRDAERALGRSCRVAMDLGGPKLRTAGVEPGPRVLRVRPKRDALGRVRVPARLTLAALPPPGQPALVVPEAWLARLKVGDTIAFDNARGARRRWTVVEASAGACRVEGQKTAYLVPGTLLRRMADTPEAADDARIGQLRAEEGSIVLKPGDRLIVTRDGTPGRAAQRDERGEVVAPARIGCTIPEALRDVRPGEAIWFDDGRIGGSIVAVHDDRIEVTIAAMRTPKARLRGDRGINLPDSRVRLSALTPRDIEDLRFVAAHADVVELSFASSARDVAALQAELDALGGAAPAIVLKVESRRGFDNLPAMLLTAMRRPVCGVMIARGDLAIECGFERLAEVQEEILWICEAAHVPVIWATQVLEGVSKQGLPSRAEITDAAMGHRAECVMLNKGPHIVQAVRMLDDILQRMQAHQRKKRAMLRELKLAHIEIPGPD